MILVVKKHRQLQWFCLAGLLAVLSSLSVEAQQRFELDGDQWVAEKAPDPTTPEGQLQRIRKLLAQNSIDEAQKWAETWLKEYPNHPGQAEARLLLGDSKVAKGDYYESLFDYEIVIRQYPASPQFFTALQREFDIATLFTRRPNRVWRRFLGMRIIPGNDEGVELFIRIQERVPGSRLGERASLALGDYYYEEGNMFMASEAYDVFLLNYPNSENREWAMLRLIQANLARFKGPEFDPTGLLEAAERLKLFRSEFPAAADQIDADGLFTRIEESLAAKEYAVARWYERRNEPVSADYLYRRLINEYPRSSAAEQAIARLEVLQGETSLNLNPALAPRDTQQEIDVMNRQEQATDSPGVGQTIDQEKGIIDPTLDETEARLGNEAQRERERNRVIGDANAIEQDILQDEAVDDEMSGEGVENLNDPEINPTLQEGD